jgi:hypothetical protein
MGFRWWFHRIGPLQLLISHIFVVIMLGRDEDIPSKAMFAPDRALVGISSLSVINDAKVSISVPLTSTPLMAVMARAPGWTASYRIKSDSTV